MPERSSTTDVSRRVRGRDVALGLAVNGFRAGVALGRIGLLPVRVAAGIPLAGLPVRRAAAALDADGAGALMEARRQLEAAAASALASPEVARTLDRLLAGPLVEAVARSLVARRVAERVVDQLLREARPETIEPLPDRPTALVAGAPPDRGLERLVQDVLGSPALLRLTDEVLRSAEMQRVVEHVAGSPELRRAITRQSTTFAGEVAAGMRRRTESMDATVETAVRGVLRRSPRGESQ